MRREVGGRTEDNIDNDFGFSTVDVDDLPRKDEGCCAKLDELEKLIIPLLDKLLLNPEKEYFKWPNRKAIIEKQKAKILKITRG